MANILNGKEVSTYVDNLSKKMIGEGKHPTLAIFKVGNKDSDAAYEKGIIAKSKKIGIEVVKYVFDENCNPDSFYKAILMTNDDENIDGILVFRPLPKAFDDVYVRNLVDTKKDVDGANDLSSFSVYLANNNYFKPCTAEAVMVMLDYYNIEIKGKNVVVLGRSLVIGKPVSMLLLNRDASVTILHSKSHDVKEICQKADILICATGKMESIGKDYVRSGQTVIDVGIHYNSEKNKMCGDCKFDELEPIVENISPVPFGVGSITTSILLNHVVKSFLNKEL